MVWGEEVAPHIDAESSMRLAKSTKPDPVITCPEASEISYLDQHELVYERYSSLL